MKRIISLVLTVVLVLAALSVFASCSGKKTWKIAVPSDPTNEARALQLLEAQGVITMKKNIETDATVRDIESNPYNVEFVEVEAAQLAARLDDVDYAVINANYAIEAKLTPFVTEGTDVSFPNILAVKAGNENSDKAKALAAALNSAKVKEYIEKTYYGAVVCDLKEVTDGYDSTVDYDALKDVTISVAASPVPHAVILEQAKEILAAKGIKLDIKTFTDYNTPNDVVENDEIFANYFQHVPYLEYYNKEHGTHLVSVLEIHHEPMGIHSKNHTNLDDLKNSNK